MSSSTCWRRNLRLLKGCCAAILPFYTFLTANADSGISSSILLADSLPQRFQTEELKEIPMPDSDIWWEAFDDTVLSSLINAAVANNYNLRAALKRIEASRQMLRSTYSAYYPTLGVYTGLDFNKDSDREKLP